MKKYLQERKRFIYLVSPALIGAIFLFVCFVGINQSIWVNESYNLYLTRFDAEKITEFASANSLPPLYFFVLKAFAHFCGYNILTMRIMSTIFGAIAIVFAFLWLKYKYGSTVAIVSSFMLAISPVFIHFGQEMSMYTMVLAVVFAATFFLQLAIDNRKKIWWTIYAFLVLIGLCTHPLCALVWLAHLVYVFCIYRKYTCFIPAIVYLPCAFFIPSASSANLNLSNLTNIWSQTFLYEQAGDVTNWLVVPFTIMSVILLILGIRYFKKLRLLTALILVPIILAVLLSLISNKNLLVTNLLLPSVVATNVFAGATLVIFAREQFAKRRKKSKNLITRYPAILVGLATIFIIAMPIVGVISVYKKGNYNFETGQKTTASELFENIIALDYRENLSIIVTSADLYYNLSAYESDKHDVHFIVDSVEQNAPMAPLNQTYFGRISNLDQFLEKRDAIWYVGVALETGELEFPRDDWRITSIASMQFDDQGQRYQILKLEKE